MWDLPYPQCFLAWKSCDCTGGGFTDTGFPYISASRYMPAQENSMYPPYMLNQKLQAICDKMYMKGMICTVFFNAKDF